MEFTLSRRGEDMPPLSGAYRQCGRDKPKVNLRPETYRKVTELAFESGKPIAEVIQLAVDYAVDNLRWVGGQSRLDKSVSGRGGSDKRREERSRNEQIPPALASAWCSVSGW